MLVSVWQKRNFISLLHLLKNLENAVIYLVCSGNQVEGCDYSHISTIKPYVLDSWT